jgi:hypothetical protein
MSLWDEKIRLPFDYFILTSLRLWDTFPYCGYFEILILLSINGRDKVIKNPPIIEGIRMGIRADEESERRWD